MRHVLEAAQKQYVASLDGDDVLAPHALAALASAIGDAPSPPAMLYTDEDIVIGEHIQLPYRRPSWDPVLDLENSWIWHLVAMDRIKALEVGVYSDRGAEYCHDWDSVDRFAAAGYEPRHLADVAYHWRHHEKSTSNADGPNLTSAASVEYVLKRKIDRLGLRSQAEVTTFPIWRGAKEYWIDRRLVDLPPLVALTGAGAEVPEAFGSIIVRDAEGVAGLRAALVGIPDAAIVAVLADGVIGEGDLLVREALKLFDFVPSVGIVTGPIVANGVVVAGGMRLDSAGRLSSLEGKAEDDAGPYALLLKPHCIAAPPAEMFVARAVFLKTALADMPKDVNRAEFGLWLGAVAASGGQRVAYSPLMKVRATKAPIYRLDPVSTDIAWRNYVAIRGSGAPAIHGVAGYEPARSL
jgi:hypothetical protein